MTPVTITKDNFATEVLASDKPVLIDLWAVWCGPCRMLSPIIDEIAQEHPELKVGKINVDEQPDLAAQFQVQAIPTILAFKSGQLIGRSVGVQPKEKVLSLFQ